METSRDQLEAIAEGEAFDRYAVLVIERITVHYRLRLPRGGGAGPRLSRPSVSGRTEAQGQDRGEDDARAPVRHRPRWTTTAAMTIVEHATGRAAKARSWPVVEDAVRLLRHRLDRRTALAVGFESTTTDPSALRAVALALRRPPTSPPWSPSRSLAGEAPIGGLPFA